MTTPPDPPVPSLGLVLHDVSRLLRKRFEQRARAASLPLTRAQWSVLAKLARNEGINQAALAQLLEIEPITLVRLLDRLQAAGFVERRPDPQDRRARTLYLTPAARPMLDQIWALAAVVCDEAMDGLSDPDRCRLMGMLQTLRGNLSSRVADDDADAPERAHG